MNSFGLKISWHLVTQYNRAILYFFMFLKTIITNSNISGDNNVEIEDITDQEFSCEIETMIQDFDTVLKRSEEDEISSLQRPSHLNLSGDNTKASYAFNNRIG